MRFLLGILNSKYAQVLLSNLRGGDYHIYPEHLRNLPIPAISLPFQQPLITLVDYMLLLKNRENANLINMVSTEIISNTIEKIIDACMYELYFEDEIKASNTTILSLLQETLSKISQLPVEQQIKQFYTALNEYKNEIRNRIILQETRNESVSIVH